MSDNERTVIFQLPSVLSGQIVCIEGTVAGRSWELSAGTFVIGRRPGSDLYLPQEPGVSKTHAKIVADGEQYVLIDEESRNGTIVNGRAIRRQPLVDGDTIQICGCKLRFSQTEGMSDKTAVSPGMSTSVPSRAAPADEAPFLVSAEDTSVDADTSVDPPMPPVAEPAPGEFVEFSPPEIAVEAPLTPPPTDAWDPKNTELSRPHVTAPVRRGSAWPSFFIGLFVALFIGGGAYAGMLFVGDGAIPVVAQADEDPAPTDPAPPPPADTPLGAGAVDAPGDAPPDPADPAPGTEPPPADAPAADAPVDDAPAEPAPAADEPAEPDPPPTPPATDEPAPAPKKVAKARRSTRRKPATASGAAAADEDEDDDEPAPEPAAAAAAEPPSKVTWVPVNVTAARARKATVSAKVSGTIERVAVAVGDKVDAGDTLVVAAGSGGDDVARLEESVAALEEVVNSSGSEEAKQALEQERKKLAQAKKGGAGGTVTASISGEVKSLSVKAGDALRAGSAVAVIESSGPSTVYATVAAKQAQRLKVGAKVTLKTAKGGLVSGKVVSKSKTRSGRYTVTVDPDGAAPDDIESLRL